MQANTADVLGPLAMPRPRPYSRYLSTNDNLSGFSSIAPAFWKTAEKLKTEAAQATLQQEWKVHFKQEWKVHFTIPSAICLYHAALDCFINEEIALAIARTGTAGNGAVQDEGRSIQDETLNEKKLDRFFSFFGLDGKATTDVRDRTLLFIALRNLLYHHAPEMRDIRDYPDKVVAALKDADIEPVNTSWANQCRDVRLAEWASKAVREFIDDWSRAAGIPSRMQDQVFAG
jgi:hypothetical protein